MVFLNMELEEMGTVNPLQLWAGPSQVGTPGVRGLREKTCTTQLQTTAYEIHMNKK